jgi:hypothetical protein
MIGNICLGLASLIYLLFLGALSMEIGTSKPDMSGIIIFPVLSLALFILLTTAFCAVAGEGKLDWIGWPRGAQYFSVIVSCLTLTIIIGFSVVLGKEPASQIPWAIRPFIPWSPLVLPPVLIAVALLFLNKDLGTSVVWLRGAFAFLCGVGLLTGLGLLGEAFYWNQQRAAQEIVAIQERESDRDRMIMDQVKAADPEKDFGSLLAQTNRFEKPAIRDLALQKILSNSNFTATLAAHLRGQIYFGSALIFLRDNDPPDKAALAEPVRDAFVLAAQQVRDTMRTEFNPRRSEFISDADEVLVVADKFASYGVDYVPAIREYRAALDEPGQSPRYKEETLKADMPSRGQVDRWLAKKGK